MSDFDRVLREYTDRAYNRSILAIGRMSGLQRYRAVALELHDPTFINAFLGHLKPKLPRKAFVQAADRFRIDLDSETIDMETKKCDCVHCRITRLEEKLAAAKREKRRDALPEPVYLGELDRESDHSHKMPESIRTLLKGAAAEIRSLIENLRRAKELKNRDDYEYGKLRQGYAAKCTELIQGRERGIHMCKNLAAANRALCTDRERIVELEMENRRLTESCTEQTDSLRRDRDEARLILRRAEGRHPGEGMRILQQEEHIMFLDARIDELRKELQKFHGI